MASLVPWTDASPSELPVNTAAYYWSTPASFSPSAWTLDPAVRVDGELVGVQGFSTVSRKVGYTDNGTIRVQRRPGELAWSRTLVLTRDQFTRPEHPLRVEGISRLRAAIGLPEAHCSHAASGTPAAERGERRNRAKPPS